MPRTRVLILTSMALVGCAATDDGHFSFRRKSDSTSKPNSLASATGVTMAAYVPVADKPNEIQTVAATDRPGQPVGEVAESIVARVNGDVILRQNLISPIRGQLAKAQQEMPPAKFQQYTNELIQKQLRDLIERQLLIQEAKKTIPEAGIKRMEAVADKEFGKRIESEMKRMEVSTEAELRRKMLEQGESLDQFRDFHRGTFIAQYWLRSQLAPRLDVSREEMIDYYNLHRDQFSKERAVRWSEIVIGFDKSGGPDAARVRAEAIIKNLRAGADFAELAKAESEGATAASGGKWDLTTKGSYIVKPVDEAIFTLPPGQVSGPIEGPKGWHIVRVDELQKGGAVSFVEAQEEIRRILREQKVVKETQRYVQELAGKATITTIFDKQK